MLCLIHMHDFTSHFQQDFLAYCIRPVSVHLAMVSVGCSFNSFSVFFFLSLKQQQNLMKIVFLSPFFSNMAISPQNNEKNLLYTGKLYGLTYIYMCSCPLTNAYCRMRRLWVSIFLIYYSATWAHTPS